MTRGRERFPNSERKARILLVEDNATIASVFEAMLKRKGLVVERVENGLEAIEQVKRKYYAIVFMDLRMPELGGIETTKRIRSIEAGRKRQTPIVAFTANWEKEQKALCKAAGMDGFLTKPFRQEELNGIIAEYVSPEETGP